MGKAKNIFVKKNDLSDESSNLSNSENLSDEFKNIILGQQNNTPKKIKDEEKNKEFNITNIFSDISDCLKKHCDIIITGEVISFKISDTNAWLTIKSKEFQLSGTFWKITKDKNYQNLKSIKSGDQIVFTGAFSIMKKNLSIYFNIKSMEKIGKGNYLDIYEQYRIKIKENNLGIPKKRLCSYPFVVGIITALEGAAIQDILQTFKLDKFIGKIIIKNSIVQGAQCPKSLINSIEWFEINHSDTIDILMITRGGGGFEELVGFSDWDLLEKISSTPFVTLSAVGHQTDNQLTDEVCDYKFATPSIGAKFIVETQQKYHNNLNIYKNYLVGLLDSYNKNIIKFKFITENYQNIISKYDFKNMLLNVRKYKNMLESIAIRFARSKNNFYSKLSELKPTIMRKKELTSINDFVTQNPNKEVSPKKIEIYFIDGKISISYKITEHQHY
jgi:exodeoxyribonuclease VII large subunit